jgi:hypothetical protein
MLVLELFTKYPFTVSSIARVLFTYTDLKAFTLALGDPTAY